jgi:hypothetical protein
MRRPIICAAAVVLTTAVPISANQFADPCYAFGSAEIIFIGRVKSAPITRRISGEDEVEKARVALAAAERELKAFEALKMPPEIWWQRHLDLTIQMLKASQEYRKTRAMHPPPVDLTVIPLVVETPFRGVTTTELFMMDRGQPALDPSRSYLFYAGRPMGPLAPDIIFDASPKDVESAEADLRFLNDAVTNDQGTVVYGSLKFQDPDNQIPLTPLGGVPLRVSLDGQQYEASTRVDGTFVLTGVPRGVLRIDPILPQHLALPPQATGGIAKGGCLSINMRATFNGRLRGRVMLASGEAYRGAVEIVPHGHARHVPDLRASTNERGEFAFSSVPPGSYLLGINISSQPTRGDAFSPTYFPGTTDRSLAMPVTVGNGTEHSEIDWVVSARLREGTIAVSFDTQGQPQKSMGVCVTTFDGDLRSGSGAGYERFRADEPVEVHVVEGVRYRLVAHARTPVGFAESEIFDVIGTPGRSVVRLALASTSEKRMGSACFSERSRNTPFSPSR